MYLNESALDDDIQSGLASKFYKTFIREARWKLLECGDELSKTLLLNVASDISYEIKSEGDHVNCLMLLFADKREK